MAVWLLAATQLTGCGYRFAGGGGLPENIRRVSVSILENRTVETGLENTLTNDLIYELTRSPQAEVTGASSAQARISGIIRSLSTSTVTHSDLNTSQERRVTLVVDLTLTRSDGQKIWQRQGIAANETFSVGGNKIATERNRREALKSLSKRLAERLFASMTDRF